MLEAGNVAPLLENSGLVASAEVGSDPKVGSVEKEVMASENGCEKEAFMFLSYSSNA